MSDQQPSFSLPSAGRVTDFLDLIAYGWVLSLEVFIRHNFGSRYIGSQGAVVLLIVPFYAYFWQGYAVGPLFLFLFAYLLLCFAHRMSMFWRTRRGETTHSRYSGRSIFMTRYYRYSEISVKKYLDPFAMLVSGIEIAGWWNAPLGVYVMIGAVLMHWTVAREQYALRMRSRDLNDAVIDQGHVTEHFRHLRGEQEF